MKKELPPEERLLRLIREGGKQEEEAKKDTSAKSEASPKTIKPPSLMPLPRKKKPLSRFSNALLLIIAVSLFGYLGFEIFKLAEQQKSDLPITHIKNKPVPPEEDKKIEGMKPYSYYSQEIGKKELFKSSVLQQSQEAQGALAITDLSAGLNLLGIVWDKEPQAIIEDSKTKKSYFLYKGDNIGEMKVEDIQESKVILSYQGEKVELVP